MVTATGPHQRIPANDSRERFALELFDALWDRYRQRVSYVRTYEQVVADHNATFVNDHIALRTFGVQEPLAGICSISRIFEALGYCAAGNYFFRDKHLNAIHYQHPNPQFPKIFISELRVWELAAGARSIIQRLLADHGPTVDERLLIDLDGLKDTLPDDTLPDDTLPEELMRRVVACFHELPWAVPEKQDVLSLNEQSQYAAWVAVHGYNVNHFTSLINSHAVPTLETIDKTVEALKQAGVPMKQDVEGKPGSRLRQTATEAVMIDVDVQEKGSGGQTPWTYAYFELAERGNVTDETGAASRFEGFLGPQATQLFEMTKIKT